MTIQEKLTLLKGIMKREGLEAYIISGSDPHNNEYLPSAWKQREWISGFTGSFGTVVVTLESAGLWTDTRYFIQAKKQLADSSIELHKLRVPHAIDYPEWLSTTLKPGNHVGVDGFCMSVQDIANLRDKLSTNNIKVVEKTDLLGEIWLDRPALPETPVCLLSEKYAGESVKNKIDFIKKELHSYHADYFLFSALDEIAWLFNIRGQDIEYNPLVICYAIVGKEKSWLFVKQTKLSSKATAELQRNGIEIRDYHHVSLFLEELEKGCQFLADLHTLNYAIYNKLQAKFSVTDIPSPIIQKKAIKNPIEIDGFKKACIKDGIAMTRFFFWLEQVMHSGTVSET